MTFINKIKSSIYGPSFYGELSDKPLKFSIKYFLSLVLCLSFVYSFYLSFIYIPVIKDFLSFTGSEVVQRYPANLVVTIKDGQASTNAKEPYFVKMPEDSEQSKATIDPSDPENILVIDTKSAFDINQFDQYKTVIILKKDTISVKDGNGKITIRSLKDMPDLTINKANVSSWVDRLVPIGNKLVYLVPILMFFVMFISYVAYLLHLFIAGLFVWLLFKLRKIKMSYKQSYQISLHAVTLPFLLYLLSDVLNLPIFKLTILIILIVVLVNFKKSKTVS